MNCKKILLVALLATSIQYPAFSISAQGFYLDYRLSFYNLFSPHFHAFRRTHQFVLGYYASIPASPAVLNLEVQYNWIDEVKGKVSSHNLTAWVLNLAGTFNNSDTVKLQYRYFTNLTDSKLNRGCAAIEYSRLFTGCAGNFFARARAGIGFSHFFLPVYGINAVYLPGSNTNINFKLNWLEESEDNPEFAFKLPVSLGFVGRFSSRGPYDYSSVEQGIGLEYIWDPLRSHLISSEGEITNHWLKGYIGDRFWF